MRVSNMVFLAAAGWLIWLAAECLNGFETTT